MQQIFNMKINSWHIFVVVGALLNGNSCVPAIRTASQRAIIFPDENWDDCYLDDASTIPGLCKSLDDCPDVLRKWDKENIVPKTCYFLKTEQFVCCPTLTEKMENQTSAPIIKETTETNVADTSVKDPVTLLIQRRSELECELHQTFEQTVVNGLPTKPNEFPFMAALGWSSDFFDKIWYRCGGVLISSKFVLTAAHCAEMGGDSPNKIHIGGANLTDSDIQNVNIKRIVKHPGYNETSIYNDIALVELEQEVNNTIACLWTTYDLDKPNVTALGYGNTRFGGLASNQLLKAPLKTVSKSDCENYYKHDADLSTTMEIADTHLCAGDPDKLRDTCQGDSGGPLIMEFGRTAYVVGITSFGLGCAGEPPSIYTRVSSFIEWIEDIVWPKIDVRFN